MSVNIGISANPSQAVNAFDSVREAIRRAGQEGRAFRDLDLSHPELAGFAQDLGRMQQQLEDLMRVSQGATARSARRVFSASPANPLDWGDNDPEWARHFPDEAERRRLQTRVQQFVTQGTQFAPASSAAAPPPPSPILPPRPPRPGRDEDEEESPVSRAMSSGLGMLKRGGMFALGMAGVGSVGHILSSGVSTAHVENSEADSLLRSLGSLSIGFDELRSAVRDASKGMLVTHQEALRMERSYARIFGDSPNYGSSVGFGAGPMQIAGGMATGWGMSATSAMTSVARADASGIAPERWAAMVGDAAAQGMQTGNVERVQESMLRYLEQTSRILVGSGGNVSGFAGAWAAMNATHLPGFIGDNATAMLSTMDTSIRQGGRGGHASEALNYRAFARHGVTDPYKIAGLMEGGMFQEIGEGKQKTTILDAVMEQINREYEGRGDDVKAMAVSREFGIGINQAKKFLGLNRSGVDMSRTADFLSQNGLSASNIKLDALADISKVLSGHGSLAGTRDEWLRSHESGAEKLSAEEAAGLRGATGGDLRTQLALSMARHGTTHNVQQDTLKATVDLGNTMTETGQLLVAPLNAIKEIASGILTGINKVADFFVGGSGSALGRGTPNTGPDGPDPDGRVGAAIMSTIAFRTRLPGGIGGGGGGPVNGAGSIPLAERGRILAAATAGTMVPPELLDGLISQESGWRADAQRRGGSDLGLGQITDSTAASPGYGMEPISHEDRLDPAKNARWTARYLEARGRALGLRTSEDWHDRAKVSRALRGYNGGGDGQYPEHVLGRVHVEPLRVIHEDRHGNVLHEEHLQVRPVGAPMPYGAA